MILQIVKQIHISWKYEANKVWKTIIIIISYIPKKIHSRSYKKSHFYLPHYLLFCTMANSTNFRYLSLRKLQTSTSDAIIDTTFWSNDWCQKVELCMLLHLASFVNLNMSCWLSRSLAFKTLDTKVSTPSTNWVLPK